MSLSVKHLNADTSFLLAFSPPYADPSSGNYPGSFTILIDPWLSGPSKIWNSKFAVTTHTIPPCVNSLAELPEPDVVLISQDKDDHCHKETMLQLAPDTRALILGTSAAVRKIRGWKHFDPVHVQPLRAYDECKQEPVYRVTIPPFSPSGSAGEVTITLLAPKLDLTGLHNAIGITYRPPSSVLSNKAGSYVNLRKTYLVNQDDRASTPTPHSTTFHPSPLSTLREKTISVLYSPHGINYDDNIKPYASTHLLAEAALPLTVLLHSFDRLSNPWYFGGNICAGAPSGTEIAKNLFARAWISAHDEEKMNAGISVQQMKKEEYGVKEVRRSLQSLDSGVGLGKAINTTELLVLAVGEEYIFKGS